MIYVGPCFPPTLLSINWGFPPPIQDISPSTLICVAVCDTWPQTNSTVGLFLNACVTYLGLCELFNYTEGALGLKASELRVVNTATHTVKQHPFICHYSLVMKGRTKAVAFHRACLHCHVFVLTITW